MNSKVEERVIWINDMCGQVKGEELVLLPDMMFVLESICYI